jgi:hypothetical protein
MVDARSRGKVRSPSYERKEDDMYVRVVRFADVDAASVESVLARIRESDGPPAGVEASGIRVLFDEGQGTAVVLQSFETAADMEEAARIFGAMDPADTPGTRVSVDACELKLDLAV